MIGYLRGKILENTGAHLLVLNGPGDVGYLVQVPGSAEYGLMAPGESIELHVYTHVREDALDLFGFRTRQEKELFLLLLGVNGVGPKVALGILARVEPATLIEAVLSGDKERLTRVPGIGKKTAERVVLELADTFKKRVESGAFSGMSAVRPAGASANPSRPANSAVRDATDALIGLGYREQEIERILEKMIEEGQPARAEELVRNALKSLA